MARRKTVVEKFFSLNWHRKRWGAGRLALISSDYAAMKEARLPEGEVKQTRGSDKSLERHLENLKLEFAGQPEIVFHHARLIVLLRRDVQTAAMFAEFQKLWREEAVYLCDHLNIRWLISACDTFVDRESDPAHRNLALAACLLVNTVKIYESERFITASADNSVLDDRVERLQTELVPLFEGLSCFTVGTDDTLRNMRWRLETVFGDHPLGLILKTIYERLQVNDTAFARLRTLHRRERTAWW